MKILNTIIVISLLFTISLFLVPTNADAFSSLKSKIQKELDVNPYLKKQKVKLRVTGEESGYVTIEMYEGNRGVREAIE